MTNATATTTATTTTTTRAGVSATTAYLRLEWKRTVRNRRFFVFSLAIPLVLLLTIAGPNRHEQLGGLPFAAYYMTGMVAWGSMAAVIAGGGRIAAERSIGWNRQLRTTPLRTSVYLFSKVATGYGMAMISIGLLYTAGVLLDVRMPATRWIEMTALILVGLIPFAAIGMILGHLLTVDSMGPAMGGLTSMFALLGGSWGPIAEHGIMHTIAQLLPSYWLVRSGRVGVGGDSWPAMGWLVIAVWSVAMIALAIWAHRRDTGKA